MLLVGRQEESVKTEWWGGHALDDPGSPRQKAVCVCVRACVAI